MGTPEIDKKMNLTDEQVFRLIQSLSDRFNGRSQDGSVIVDPRTFSGRVNWRRQHLHNLPDVDPVLDAPWDDGNKYQSDLPRRITAELVSRLTENPVTVDVSSPKETATTSSIGDDFATVLSEIWRDIEQRLQINIQRAVSTGQAAEVFGLMHFRMDHDLVPEVEDYEEMDDMPDCPMCEGTSIADGKICPECQGQGIDQETAKRFKPQDNGKYRETDESLQTRTAQKRAAAGTPFYVELPDVSGFMWMPDRSARPGFAIGCLTRKVSLLDYCAANGDIPDTDDIDATSIEEMNDKILIGEERASPHQWMPSWVNWSSDQYSDITVYEFWTRDEYYEVVSFNSGGSTDSGNMVLRKSFKHPYNMPPFVLIPAIEYNVADPVLKYEPYLEGVYRIKPFYDRKMTLLDVMAEKVALSYYYWRNTSTGAPMLSEDGESIVKFTRDSATANVAPPGYELVKAEDVSIHPAFVDSVRHTGEELKDAAPPTGQAEVTATTQPFAIKMQQDQASIILRNALRNQVTGFQMFFDWVARMLALPAEDGGYGETLYVNPSKVDASGRRITDRSRVIGVDPKEIDKLTINVNISGTSQAEQTTRIQIGIQLLNDPNITIPRKKILQDYFGIERPEDMIAEFNAQTTFDSKIRPGLVDRELAKRFGGLFIVAPNGQPVGFGGQSATPQDVLKQNGMTPVVPQQQPQGNVPAGMPPAPGAPPPPPPMGMGPMNAMQVPGAMPVPGMQG